MKSCILHFGMPKTGTTSIQMSLLKNLPDDRYCYLNFGTANSSKYLATAFLTNPQRYPLHLRKDVSASEIESLREQYRGKLGKLLDDAEGKTAILSAEHLTGFSIEVVRSLNEFLSARCSGIEAVGYIRPPKSFVESWFQQKLKSDKCAFDLEAIFPKYRFQFEKFDKTFGSSRTHFWLFKPEDFPSGDVVVDFCQRLGFDYPLSQVRHVNDSISLPAVKLLYAYRKFGPFVKPGLSSERSNNLLLKKLCELPGEKLRFSESLIRPLIDKYQSEIDWMERRMDASLAEDLAKDDERAIHEEQDLFKYDEEALRWLAGQLQPSPQDLMQNLDTPNQVALMVHRLRKNLWQDYVSTHKRKPSLPTKRKGNPNMKIDEVVQEIKSVSSKQVASLPDVKLKSFLRKAFGQILQELETTNEGLVKVSGLGSFRIKQVEVEKDNAKTLQKRIVFHPAKTKAKTPQ